MRSFMRQDPDIIMVGELRDLETAEIVAQAALTGHLVLTALHTPDAPSALTRLLDIGLAPFIVAATLTGVIGQRLVRKVCPACREGYQPEENLVRMLGFTPETRPADFTHGTGCAQCAGYRLPGTNRAARSPDDTTRRWLRCLASGRPRRPSDTASWI